MQRQRAKLPVLLSVSVCALLLPGFVSVSAMNTMTRISASELHRLILAGNPPAIVDVRTGLEYRHGHVPGAIHMPFWKSLWMADDLTVPREKPLVVYCAHGPRAGIGRFALLRAGFSDVRYLDGHMSGWVKADLPVEAGKN